MRRTNILQVVLSRRCQTVVHLTLAAIALLMVTSFSANAQSRVTINSAEEVIGVTMQGERVRKLIGDVSLKTQDMVMYCDSAYQYLEKSEVRAFGNIEIETPDEQIYADTLIYFTDVDFSQLRGRVVIEADSATLFSQALDYRFSTKVGHFIEHVRLEDPDGVLTANSGFYYREPDSAVFRGNVQLTDSLQYAEGDSLFINRRKNTSRLYGNIFVDDNENNVMLKGDSLKADSVGHRFLEGNAWLMKVEAQPQADTTIAAPDTTSITADSTASHAIVSDLRMLPDWYLLPDTTEQDTSGIPNQGKENENTSAAADTTHIRARIIHSIQTDTQTVINAYRNVRIWSPKFAAIADTAFYNDETEVFKLRSNPTAWHKQIQLTGPYIEVQLAGGEIDELISYPSPFVVQQDTALNRLNQITGDTLNAYFTDGELSRIHFYPSSHVLRFMKKDNGSNEPDGAVDITAASMRIFFNNGQLIEAKALGPADGMYLPESEQTAKRRLDGFVWTPEQRPQKPTEPMERRLPPIPEDPPFELPPRYVSDHQENLGEEDSN